MKKIGLGGGCHWCTEAIFQSVKGVTKVEQGWLSPADDTTAFSEGVLVYYEPDQISIEVLIAVHLHTHSATSKHKLRGKYRSAIYVFDQDQAALAKHIVSRLSSSFQKPVITGILLFGDFKLNQDHYLNYYYRNPQMPFCETHIRPKLKLLLKKYSKYLDLSKVNQSLI